MRSPRAFSLIELLVVISIIALLVAILLPSLRAAKRSALQLQCGVNLKQWGVALSTYNADHNGRLPKTNIAWGAIHGFNVWGSSSSAPGEFSAEMMRGYVEGVDFTNKTVRKTSMWWCPVANADGSNNSTFNVNAPPNSTWNSTGYFYMDYSYFGRVSSWGVPVTNASDFIDTQLTSTGLLMTDNLILHNLFSGWQYNHGRSGPSHHNNASPYYNRPVDLIEGIHRLFGDGRVEWKGASRFNLTEVATQTPSSTTRWIQPGGVAHTY